ncbi:1-aminocyclopropane-1-carboxylate deaminase/D-cysteine desulfhydrase [Streptomyces luteocolor]|uniref:1-aminocyclopropane-1-carboxylate deaminase/D-cysteine desulfhydrase n=1 Tax=Streptomyces luteocolor TaxID=285500 RepID=UPI000853DD9D|nr:pyridoxal-phosphate dependent enzyme [Streptomyces luteocolor]
MTSPLQRVDDDRFGRRGVELLLKRDDLIHPDLPGNKYRKLVLNLRAAAEAGHDTLLTFGGAYSNHLRATAAAGRLLGLATVGVVRGDELADRPLNPSLARCAADGMRLRFVARSTYRRKTEPQVLAALLRESGAEGAYVIPEGGSNTLAVQGCTALGEELRDHTDVAAVACGTGGTLAGLAAGLGPDRRALGIPVLKGGFLGPGIRELQRRTFGEPTGNWRLDERFHHGGYARTPPALLAFAEDFEARHGAATGLSVERLYVAKLLYALTVLSEEGAFRPGTRLTAVITGPREDPVPAGPRDQSSTSR